MRAGMRAPALPPTVAQLLAAGQLLGLPWGAAGAMELAEALAACDQDALEVSHAFSKQARGDELWRQAVCQTNI